jgi:hypothetical protein
LFVFIGGEAVHGLISSIRH